VATCTPQEEPGLDKDQVTLIRNSFTKVAPIAPQAAELFYNRLFELDPSVRPLFKGDTAEQGRKLMAMIATAVANADNLPAVAPAVRELGARHVGYGVRPEHYAIVGATLLWTLEKGLGDAFTAPCRAAWTALYGAVAAVMQMGA